MDRNSMARQDALDDVLAWRRWLCGAGIIKRIQNTVALVLVTAVGRGGLHYNDLRVFYRMYRKPMARLGGMGLFGFAF